MEAYIAEEKQLYQDFVKRARTELIEKLMEDVRAAFEKKLENFGTTVQQNLTPAVKTVENCAKAELPQARGLRQAFNIEAQPTSRRAIAARVYNPTIQAFQSDGRVAEMTGLVTPKTHSRFDVSVNAQSLLNLFDFTANSTVVEKIKLPVVNKQFTYAGLSFYGNDELFDYFNIGGLEWLFLDTECVRRIRAETACHRFSYTRPDARFPMADLTLDEKRSLSIGFVWPHVFFIYLAGQAMADCFKTGDRMGSLKKIRVGARLNIAELIGLGDDSTFLNWNRTTNTLQFLVCEDNKMQLGNGRSGGGRAHQIRSAHFWPLFCCPGRQDCLLC